MVAENPAKKHSSHKRNKASRQKGCDSKKYVRSLYALDLFDERDEEACTMADYNEECEIAIDYGDSDWGVFF